jgi:translocator protein
LTSALTAAFFAIFFALKNKDVIYLMVFTWAFIGIGVKNAASNPAVSYTAYALASVISIVVLIILKNEKSLIHS